MFAGSTHSVRVSLLIASVAGGCVRQLPALPPPPPIPPPVQAPAPPPGGHGRLVIDVVDGPTPVQRITMEARPTTNAKGRTLYRFFESPQILCQQSPCIADVPMGNVILGFPVLGDPNASEVELVYVGPDPSMYRRSLSVYDDNTGATRVLGIIATALGGASLTTGIALLPIGLAKDNDALTWAGGLTLGGGAALLTLGILMIRADAPTFRPGSSNHYPLQ